MVTRGDMHDNCARPPSPGRQPAGQAEPQGQRRGLGGRDRAEPRVDRRPAGLRMPEDVDPAVGGDAHGLAQQQAAADADVSVDPRYGRWDGASGRVVAPGKAATTEAASGAATGAATAGTSTGTADTAGG